MYRVLNHINSKNKYFRKTSPKDTLKLWKCLESINYRKNKKKFIKEVFDRNQFETYSQLKTILDNCLDDKLIEEDIDQKKGYRLCASLPRKHEINEINDWYCFECHSCGPNQELKGCKSCFRSFHNKCLETKQSNDESILSSQTKINHKFSETFLNPSVNQTNNESEEQQKVLNECHEKQIFSSFESCNDYEFECRYCQRFQYPDNGLRSQQICGQQLEQLIQLFLSNMEKTIREENGIDIYEELSIKMNINSYSLLFYPLDLKTIRDKAFQLKNYKSFVEFENELRHFHHNFLIVSDKTSILLFSNVYNNQMEELNKCFDCYLWCKSPPHERIPPEKWFTRVCDPPHELVFAKVSRYPYWPSKVIYRNQMTNEYKVQFFEQNFSTSIVSQNNIRDINYKIASSNSQNVEYLKALVLLYKYLKNLQRNHQNFVYKSLVTSLETIFIKRWRDGEKDKFENKSNKYEFLKELDIEFTAKRKLTLMKSTQHYSQNKRIRTFSSTTVEISYEPLKRSINDSSENSSDSSSDESEDSNHSNVENEDSLNVFLENPILSEEHKFKFCCLLLQLQLNQMRRLRQKEISI